MLRTHPIAGDHACSVTHGTWVSLGHQGEPLDSPPRGAERVTWLLCACHFGVAICSCGQLCRAPALSMARCTQGEALGPGQPHRQLLTRRRRPRAGEDQVYVHVFVFLFVYGFLLPLVEHVKAIPVPRMWARCVCVSSLLAPSKHL